MIHTTCPKCDEELEFPLWESGKTVPCPICKAPVKVPGKAAKVTSGTRESVTAGKEAPEKIRMVCPMCDERFTVPGEERGEYVECPGCGREILAREPEVTSGEREEERPKRRRRRRRRREAFDLSDYLNLPIMLGAVGVLAVLGLGLGLLKHDLMVLPAGLGGLVMLTGFLWMIINAFRQNVAGAIMLIVGLFFCPSLLGLGLLLYIFYNELLDFNEFLKPLLVLGVGVVILVVALAAGAALAPA
jgi:hypothetical protein